jgi:hypothetical protein
MDGADARLWSIRKSPGVKSSPGWYRENTRISASFTRSSTPRLTISEILAEAAVPEIADADLQASRFDHARDLRKHEPV